LIIVAGVGVPYTIARRATEQARELGFPHGVRKRRDSYEENDEIWTVFDRDAHPQFDEAVKLCEQNRVGVARSNPCFELWLILHEADYDKPDGSHTPCRLIYGRFAPSTTRPRESC
jgi:hypothetical protein